MLKQKIIKMEGKQKNDLGVVWVELALMVTSTAAVPLGLLELFGSFWDEMMKQQMVLCEIVSVAEGLIQIRVAAAVFYRVLCFSQWVGQLRGDSNGSRRGQTEDRCYQISRHTYWFLNPKSSNKGHTIYNSLNLCHLQVIYDIIICG